jgi:hypothetical protein
MFAIVGAALFIAFLFWRARARRAKRAKRGDYNTLRGARMVAAEKLAGMIKEPARLDIGGVPIPYNSENRGLLLSGAPGTGKSAAITRMLDVISAGARDFGFVADRSGIYTARYYNPDRDVILNPLDGRASAWSPLAEIRDEWDCETIAKAIVPDAPGESGEWNRYAQIIVSAILLRVWRQRGNNGEVLRLAQQADMEELAACFAGTAAIGLLQNDKMFGSIRGIVSTYTAGFARLDPAGGCDAFSIKGFVQKAATGGGRFMFFNYASDQLKPLRRVIATMADIFADAVMVLPPAEHKRRAWLVLDEFASLGRIESMENFLTNSRKYGGAAILGMQSIAQIHALYSRDNATAMLSSIGTQLVLRTSDPETAEYHSKAFGDRQILRTNRSGGGSSSAGGESAHENWSQQVTTERLILPADLLTLPNLAGFLKLAGSLPAAPLLLPIPSARKPAASSFERSTRLAQQQPAADAPQLAQLEAGAPQLPAGLLPPGLLPADTTDADQADHQADADQADHQADADDLEPLEF